MSTVTSSALSDMNIAIVTDNSDLSEGQLSKLSELLRRLQQNRGHLIIHCLDTLPNINVSGISHKIKWVKYDDVDTAYYEMAPKCTTAIVIISGFDYSLDPFVSIAVEKFIDKKPSTIVQINRNGSHCIVDKPH